MKWLMIFFVKVRSLRGEDGGALTFVEGFMKRSIAGCFILCGVAVLGSSTGCGTSPSSTTSTIQGTIDQASLPSPISSLTVSKSDGTSRTVAVDAVGRFTIALDPGASYRLFLGADGHTVPVAVRSTSGALGERLTITSAGASVNIGTVRYWHGTTPSLALPGSPESVSHPTMRISAAPDGVTPYILTGLPTVPTTPSLSSPNGCVNGVLSTGQPCATESAPVKCADEDGDDDLHHGGCMHMGGDSAGEHHDGDGNRGGVADADDDVDSSAPFGVAGLNVSGDIGCDDDHDHHHHGDDHDTDHQAEND
jgi:hypothetical protein